MVAFRVTLIVGFLGCITVFSAGCTTTSRSASASDATTPQAKAHDEQLAEMGHEDAEAARRANRRSEAKRTPSSGRRAGQGIVDQPIRP